MRSLGEFCEDEIRHSISLQPSYASSNAPHRNCESNTRTSPFQSPMANRCPVQSIEATMDGSTTIFTKAQSCQNHLVMTRPSSMSTLHKLNLLDSLGKTKVAFSESSGFEVQLVDPFSLTSSQHTTTAVPESLLLFSGAPLPPWSSSPVLQGVIHPQCLVVATRCQQTAAPSDATDDTRSISERLYERELLKLWASQKTISCMTHTEYKPIKMP